ncbi:MAG: sulfite exporter TauE/SafE family protein [candidate division WOR-3 bacterium]
MEAAGLFLIAVGAGTFGALLGLGGGIILVPALTLLFQESPKHAVAASLVAVVANSCVGVQTFLARDQTDLPVAIRLLVPTVLGAIVGARLGTVFPADWVAGLFIGLILYVTAQLLLQKPSTSHEEANAPLPTTAFRKRVGLCLSFLAGVISALLGVGGGILQVPVLHLMWGTPLWGAVATSNFLLGPTGTTSALLYFASGLLKPDLAVPCALGVMVGAQIGARLSLHLPLNLIRWLFSAVMLYTAWSMFKRWFL